MSRTKFGRSIDRRSALKTIAAGGAAVVGISSSGVAAASSTYSGVDSSRVSDNVGDGYFEHNLGTGLRCVDANPETGGTASYTFELTGDGVVLNEDGEMPVTEGEGYTDSFPRINHRGNVGKQGPILEKQYGDGVGVTVYSSRKNLAPKDHFADVVGNPSGYATVLGAAFNALGAQAAGYALTAAQLAKYLVSFAVNDDGDPVWDYTQRYGQEANGFLRGGHALTFTINVLSGSTGGLVTAKSEFGTAEVGYDIQVDNNGFRISPS